MDAERAAAATPFRRHPCPAGGAAAGRTPIPSLWMPRLAQSVRSARPGLLRAVRGGRPEHAVLAADLLERLLSDFPDSGELAGEILDCEHEGDRITHDIIDRLNHTFVTPIDREDILALASGARRHRRLHRGGRRLPRALQDRGADGPGDQPGAGAERRRAARSAEAIPLLRGFRDISQLHGRDQPAGERGRPDHARGGRLAVRRRRSTRWS